MVNHRTIELIFQQKREQADLDVIGHGFPPTQFAEAECRGLRANVISAVVGGLGGLFAVLAIGIAVGCYHHGLPWLRALWAALV